MLQGKPKLSIYLDKRFKLSSGLFPVKLRATFLSGSKRVHKYYPCLWPDGTKIQVTQKLFETARGVMAEALHSRLKDIEQQARDHLKRNDFVNQEIFTRLMGGGAGRSVCSLFEKYIAELTEAGRVGNRAMYNTTLNSIKEFAGDPSFMEITVDWLNRYTAWMKKPRKVKYLDKAGQEKEKTIPGKSVTTIAMYLRCLRKIYNDAIFLKYISADYYPFGKRQYTIQEVRNSKTALSEQQKDQVLQYETADERLRKAVDFWIFSYLCNGMNFADIARLKNSDIREGVIFYNRQKTINTSRVLMKIEIPLRKEAQQIIARWGRRSLDPDEFVFPILERSMTASQAKYKVQDFIDQVNRQLRTVARDLKLNFKLTTYVARHTFGHIAKIKGHPLEEIKEAMGHSSMKTTEIYTGSFSIEKKRKRSMDF